MHYFILSILICFQLLDAQTLGKWRWAVDDMTPTDDKQTHAVGSFGLYYFLVHKGVPKNKAVTSVMLIGITKECYDALVPWERYGRLGGDGFSRYDIFYNGLGIIFAYRLDKNFYIMYIDEKIMFIYPIK